MVNENMNESAVLRHENGFADNTNLSANGCKELTTFIQTDKEPRAKQENVIIDEERGVWGNKLQFFLAIMGYTVGVGSVWRFPIICSRNGGGAFLIPFFFFLITCGGPLYYLEVCLGQFTGLSAGFAFEYCPLLKGLGWLQVILSLTVLWYLMFVLTWVLYFLYWSFYPTLPWMNCDNSWNTKFCIPISAMFAKGDNDTLANSSQLNYNMISSPDRSNYSSSAFEFWEYQAIRRSAGLEDLGHIQLHLVICCFLSWAFTTLAVIKGVKTLGKVVYVTATAPYVFLTIMLIKGLTLDGAVEGIKTYLTPDFSKLLTIQVWLEAAIQVFFSLGPSWGGVITMASYNKFHQKSFWSSTMCVASSGFTSFYNGLVVFALLGFMAKESGRTVAEVAKQSGPGLAFIAFPTVLSRMALPQLWSVLFFLTLVAVVFDSLFGMLETVTSAIVDMFPQQLIKRRVHVNAITGFCFFLVSLPLTMNGGIYMFQLADWYFSAFALLLGTLGEGISLCWIYGTERFARDIHIMTGRDVSVLLRVMWTVVIPIFALLLFIIMLLQYSAPVYGQYVYSNAATTGFMMIGLVPVLAVLIEAVYILLKESGSFYKRLYKTLQPSDQWQPHKYSIQKEYRADPFIYPQSWTAKLWLNIRGTKQNPYF